MAASYLNTWNPAVKVAAHTTFVSLLYDNETVAPYIAVFTSDDVLLATINLVGAVGNPSYFVNDSTGQVTLVPDGREDAAPNSGIASYATLFDGSGTAFTSVPCIEGLVSVSGKCVLNTLTVIEGSPVEMTSWTVL